jgi:hypothetical protein
MTRFCPPHRASRRKKPRKPHNPPWTEEEDEALRELYGRYNGREIGPHLRARFHTRPGWSLKRRASAIGAATVRKKEPPWSAEEEGLLREWAWMSPERIVVKFRALGYKRTLTAIAIRMKRLGTRKHIDGMTATALSKLMNVDGHTVMRWIADKSIAAERSGTTGDNHDRWYIPTAAIQAFFWAHPEAFELSKIERAGSKMWFLEMVSGGRIREHEDEALTGATLPAVAVDAPGDSTRPARTVPLYGERVTLTALAEISGRSVQTLLHRIDGLGLGVEAAAFGDEGPEASAAAGAASPLGAAMGRALTALMKKHKAKPRDLAAWVGVPEPMIVHMMSGTIPTVSPALLTAVEKLDGEIVVTIKPKLRDYDR